MAELDKKDYNKQRYKDMLREGKKSYQIMKDFVADFSMAPEVVSAAGTGEVTDDSGGGGGGSMNGEMPTVDQYTGPDVYYDEIIGRNYQSGLKAKIKGTDKWNKDIKEQAAKAGVNPLLIKVLMATESGGVHSSRPNSANCVGLMQVKSDLTRDMGLDWNKVKNDPVYNIYAGCMATKNKHEYAKTVIKNNNKKYRDFKSRGFELRANCHGVAWLFNGFSVPSKTSNKVTTGGYLYGSQIVAMLKGFGRDGIKDTALTLDVLGGGSSDSSNSATNTSSKGSGGKWEYKRTFASGAEVVKFLKTVDTTMINGIHVHHTYSPNHADFKKHGLSALQDGMKKAHLQRGFSTIAQHMTIAPTGEVMLGRDISMAPASATGWNGSEGSHPAMFETIGNFDKGNDKLEGKQLESAIAIAKYFAGRPKGVMFHRECLLHGKQPKSCPGTGVDKKWFMNLVNGSAKANSFTMNALDVEAKELEFEELPEDAFQYGCDLGEDLEPDTVIEDYVTNDSYEDDERELLSSSTATISVPLVKIKNNDTILAPKYRRQDYVQNFKSSMSFNLKTNYSPLPPHEFLHSGGPQENLYTYEARQAFLILKNRLGYRTMTVSRGFDPTDGQSSHSIGIAMDIFAPTPDEAIRIADCAWASGFRAIAIGPRFVHLDIGPPAAWNYGELPVYRGPNTVKVGDIEDGF